PRPQNLTLSVLLTASFAAAQTTWQSASSIGAPAPNGTSSWDSSRERIVAFGGQLGSLQQAATKEWTGSAWVTINTANSPSARTRPAMAYDEARGETVLFGGGSSFTNDTWTYDGTDWTQKSPSTVPAVRFGSAMAYDKVRQVIVMVGGFVPSGLDANDIWEWDGNNWTQRPPNGGQPPPRGAHRMTFDESINQIVLVGGFRTAIGQTVSDTWSWSGTNWTQTLALPGLSRCDQALGYDKARQRIIMYGGSNIISGAQTQLDDTWEWSGGTWTQRLPSNWPGNRSGATTAYIPSTSSFLIAGGNSFQNVAAPDTWFHRSLQLGSAVSNGLPCAVTSGAQLEPVTLPYLGLPFTQQIVNAEPTAQIGLIVFGSSWQFFGGLSLPLELSSIGAPGCWLNASLDVVNTVILTNGTGGVTWNIPNLAAAAGFAFATQGAVLDPTSPLTLQLDMTSGRNCIIGNP
ncbi:MAG: hypothetical protein ACI91B_001860, partial [Planctomycetota bacterium]